MLRRTVAAQKTKRRSRKRRSTDRPPPVAPPPVASSQQRSPRAGREPTATRSQPVDRGALGTVGERPASPFGGLPVSELAILAGAVGIVVGLIRGAGPALIVGLIVCALGVLEVTAREHFSGYRSHTTLLAAVPAVGVEAGLVSAFGEPRDRALLLLAAVPVFAIAFWLLRRRFQRARQARLARPPAW